ncbi:carbohydrate sulfotransferase 12-like [Chanos chanos]|uniref:Carbohydrate sulfotransferase n=1 Tax=Chanos chanos TaxID=29144 RepID=A0A6J2V7I7_CHACN|nr:carbohydrate sulfotransferase 12-like [Chanos chanos]
MTRMKEQFWTTASKEEENSIISEEFENQFLDSKMGNKSPEWKNQTNPISLDLGQRQYIRRKLVHDFCHINGTLSSLEKNRTFYDIPKHELENLIVDDRHGIIYCYVPKVGCTQWKRVMIVLSETLKVNGVPYKNPLDISYDDTHVRTNLVFLNRFSKQVMKEKLEKYKKFIFVRHPYVRLISAYRDKFVKENQEFYTRYGVHMLRKYGNNSSPPAKVKVAHAAGILPSFSNFIQYVTDPETLKHGLFDEHWRQMYHLCHPCQINYDFIGKMETMEEDAAFLLHILHVDNIVKLPPGYTNRTAESWVREWYANIPDEWKRKLYKIYESDFKLFGYSDLGH